jgi:peptidoglycan/xylan/chitin deacetylase (PgdA/CDA1 family)
MNKILSAISMTILCCLAGSAAAGEIALSFDDAPKGDGAYYSGMERTRTLITKLDSLEIDEVVFFCVTNKLESNSARARLTLYAEAGHRLGNHTHNHPSLDEIGAKRYGPNITRAHAELAEYATAVKWFRYPYLHEGNTRPVRDSARRFLAQREYRNGYVTVDNYDWYLDRLFQQALAEGRDIDYEKLKRTYVDILWSAILFYDSIAVRTLGRSPKHVLLLHENDLAALCIDTLVQHVRAQGWKIISPTEAYTDPIADMQPDVLMNNQGRVAALAKERGYDGPLWHESEETEWLDAYCERVGVFE